MQTSCVCFSIWIIIFNLDFALTVLISSNFLFLVSSDINPIDGAKNLHTDFTHSLHLVFVHKLLQEPIRRLAKIK